MAFIDLQGLMVDDTLNQLVELGHPYQLFASFSL